MRRTSLRSGGRSRWGWIRLSGRVCSYSMGVYHRGHRPPGSQTVGMPHHVLTVTLAGPWGPVHVAATEHGVAAVEWLDGAADVSARWRRRFGFGGEDEPTSAVDDEGLVTPDAELHLSI